MSALGASLLANGVTFRVWAPRCRSVDVVVDGRAIEPLHARDGGIFDATLEGLAEGARYKFRLDATRYRPDPASRFQPEGVHGPSVVVDPTRFVWTDQEFSGHALGELVFYELHVGAFTPPGTFEAIIPHLARLVELGVTASS
jgi:maltooligosyltrehalose trehalohydrolase